jgi:serine/threonine protein kinase
MEYLHNDGIVHFDMKSANLLLGHRDRRVICKVLSPSVMRQSM